MPSFALILAGIIFVVCLMHVLTLIGYGLAVLVT